MVTLLNIVYKCSVKQSRVCSAIQVKLLSLSHLCIGRTAVEQYVKQCVVGEVSQLANARQSDRLQFTTTETHDYISS